MSAPRRWIDEGGSATPLERDLLKSALSVEPPPTAREQVWAAVLANLPPPVVPFGRPDSEAPRASEPAGGQTAGVKAATASKAAAVGILKSALVGLSGALAFLATYSVIAPALRSAPTAPVPAVIASPAASSPASRRVLGGPARGLTASIPDKGPAQGAAAGNPPPPLDARAASVTAGSPVGASVTAGSPVGAPSPEPVVAPPSSADHRATSMGETPKPPAQPVTMGETPKPPAQPVGSVERATMLREESRQVSEARDALRRGDAPGALVQLEQIRGRFPGGLLVQEREALTIEALARSGRRSDASARAAAFLQAYPTSMLAERVQTFVQ